jgi:23S rRNA-/tRNA-specific pseudouridylate synthase
MIMTTAVNKKKKSARRKKWPLPPPILRGGPLLAGGDDEASSMAVGEDDPASGAGAGKSPSLPAQPRRALGSEEVRSRLERELQKLRDKDRRSRAVPPEDLEVVYEDDHILLVDKPPGILTVPSEAGVPSLARAVFDRYLEQQRQSASIRPPATKDRGGGAGEGRVGADPLVSPSSAAPSPSLEPVTSLDHMVVHRLGMETSGLIVFAKTMEAVRGMNALFRLRRITRQYEALVCGHVRKDQGLINLPLMRDYEHPPYMRVSTDEHQQALAGLDPDVVGSKLLEAPKASLTHYQVKSREYLKGQSDLPVTRLTLTSITGRTHQLNVHMAAFGHPIVRDSVYGAGGSAAPWGGLSSSRPPAGGIATAALERAIASAAPELSMCVHASCVKFTHPATQEFLSFASEAPF